MNFDPYDFIDSFLLSYLILLTVMFKYIVPLLIILHRNQAHVTSGGCKVII
jgi:hypothetical protein